MLTYVGQSDKKYKEQRGNPANPVYKYEGMGWVVHVNNLGKYR